ncbi:MAG TPA: MEDS domain-containing protein [Gemmatimonadales bacterium]|nr:MEDS domain-containing protein [Gemmatimonadales bacterium]
MTMSAATSWEEVLRAPKPRDHLVQLYQREAFLTRAVVRFLTAGVEHGEGSVVIATPDHVRGFQAGLRRAGLDVDGLVQRHQVVILDAEDCLARFMVDGLPDRAAFVALVSAEIDRVRGAGFARVRLFGEMVELLHARSLEAPLQLEALWNELLTDRGVSLLCAYRIDNFSHAAHHGPLREISRAHSHLIPVEDYERLGEAVNRAYAEVFGAVGESEALLGMVHAAHAGAPHMPAAEGALLALRALAPTLADQVLERARHHYGDV